MIECPGLDGAQSICSAHDLVLMLGMYCCCCCCRPAYAIKATTVPRPARPSRTVCGSLTASTAVRCADIWTRQGGELMRFQRSMQLSR